MIFLHYFGFVVGFRVDFRVDFGVDFMVELLVGLPQKVYCTFLNIPGIMRTA